MSYMNKKKLAIIPFLLLNGVVILAALFKGIQISLGYYPLIGLQQVTIDYFKQVLTMPYFQKSLLYSGYLALTATFLSLVLGVLLAFLLLKVNQPAVEKIINLPISLPHIIVALMMLQLISQTGFFSRVFFQLGVIQEIDQFPLLIHDPAGVGILMVFLYKEIPYVAISTLAVLRQLQLGYIDVARNLGASKWRIFFSVILPMLQKTLITLFIILFCFTFASFEVPFLLGSPSHETVAMTAYDLFTQADLATRPQAFALNMVMSGICLLISILALTISQMLPGGREIR